jgi:hypothetical protein
MRVYVSIPEKLYLSLAAHLFEGSEEQGAFLFASELNGAGEMTLAVEDVHLIAPEGWDAQESYYLELSDDEKVRIMRAARERDCHLIECHSHRHHGSPGFSESDIRGLEEFIGYIRWKLPGKKYGALVWTASSVTGRIWDGTQAPPVQVDEVRIARPDGTYWRLGEPRCFWGKVHVWLARFLRRGDGS